MKKIIIYISLILAILLIAGSIWISNINNFNRDGSLEISVNEEPINIHRDEHGIAYVLAQNKADAIRGQGFVTAQDRLFQIEFYRALINGELASLIGESMLQSDIKMRVLNLKQKGIKSATYLNEETKNFLTWYCEGFNEYLRVAKDEFPIELSLLKITPKNISPEDIMAIIHFVGLNHARNMDDEILSLNLAAHSDIAHEILPLNMNPDRTKALLFQQNSLLIGLSKKLSKNLPEIRHPLLPSPKLGSNNWAIAPNKSASDKVIVCNDPHVDSRLLPGVFYPIGIFCPTFKSVGLALPGIPGLLIGRNDNLAFGVTNGYGDSQDLFIEETEDNFYIQEDKKIPFEKRKEIIEVKDGTLVEIEIRSTIRGPIISDFDEFGILTKDVVSLRWSQAESKSSSIGLEQFLETKDIYEFRHALAGIDNIFFNFVFGDTEGNIAHQATGLVPKRMHHLGELPQSANQVDSWNGFIPKDELPHMINPERAWVGTANNDTRPDDYPYYYSAHFSPNYRYQRMQEVFTENKKMDIEDCWNLILDCKNKQAEQLSPIFAIALEEDERTKELADVLKDWNHNDDINEIGATVYNVLYNELLNLIMNDELPDEMEESFWKSQYYWTQRIDRFIVSDHRFIDNINTEKKESLNELVIEAGVKTKNLLSEKLGSNRKDWIWGNIHTVKFASPIRQNGFGSGLLGAEEFPKKGSNQTLNRGGYTKQRDGNFETNFFASFRMVADLNDTEKMMGALSGGSSARIFHPYYKSQLEVWKSDDWIPYWLSKEKILEHSKHELILE